MQSGRSAGDRLATRRSAAPGRCRAPRRSQARRTGPCAASARNPSPSSRAPRRQLVWPLPPVRRYRDASTDDDRGSSDGQRAATRSFEIAVEALGPRDAGECKCRLGRSLACHPANKPEGERHTQTQGDRCPDCPRPIGLSPLPPPAAHPRSWPRRAARAVVRPAASADRPARSGATSRSTSRSRSKC